MAFDEVGEHGNAERNDFELAPVTAHSLPPLLVDVHANGSRRHPPSAIAIVPGEHPNVLLVFSREAINDL